MRLINYLIDLSEDTDVRIFVNDNVLLCKPSKEIKVGEIRQYLFKNVYSYEVYGDYINFYLYTK